MCIGGGWFTKEAGVGAVCVVISSAGLSEPWKEQEQQGVGWTLPLGLTTLCICPTLTGLGLALCCSILRSVCNCRPVWTNFENIITMKQGRRPTMHHTVIVIYCELLMCTCSLWGKQATVNWNQQLVLIYCWTIVGWNTCCIVFSLAYTYIVPGPLMSQHAAVRTVLLWS